MGKSSVVCGLFKQLNIPRATCTTACSHENLARPYGLAKERNAAAHIIMQAHLGKGEKQLRLGREMQSGVMDTTPSDKILHCLQQLSETRDYMRQKEHELMQGTFVAYVGINRNVIRMHGTVLSKAWISCMDSF